MKTSTIYLVSTLALIFFASIALSDATESQPKRVPSYCKQFNRDGSPNADFIRRYGNYLNELNLNRATGEVWENPIQTYGVPVATGGTFYYPIAPLGYYWGDHFYNEAECRFEYIQVWPAYDNVLNKVVYRVQSVAAKLNPPTFADDGADAEGPTTSTVQWLTPPIYESAQALSAKSHQVVAGPTDVDLVFLDSATGAWISSEQRTVLVKNQKRFYSTMLELGQIPPGLATDDLWLFWYSTTVPSAPTDVATAIAKFIANLLPLMPDPANPGYPGLPDIYVYIPPTAAVRNAIPSPVTAENAYYRPSNATEAAALFKRFSQK